MEEQRPSPPPVPVAADHLEIPTVFITEEEMAAFEAAITSAARSLSSRSLSLLQPKALRAPPSPSLPSSSRFAIFPHNVQTDWKANADRRFSNLSNPAELDVEDSGGRTTNNCLRRSKSLLRRYRMRRGLSVTDITGSEWCEKQMEFVLTRGRRELTEAMKAGSFRHQQLEEEVMKRVEIRIESREDAWALKLLNFIYGTNQLLSKGLTRELPMLQLMCYKYLWDYIVSNDFPIGFFFKFFELRPHHKFSNEIKEKIANSGLHIETLEELVNHFRAICCSLVPSHDELLLRYEHQADHAVLAEDTFTFDWDWFKSQIGHCFQFWLGKREAGYVSEDERWKCRHCSFSATCPLTQMQSNTKEANN
ncbi:exonuclease V, chloroplastic isoform X2 [Nymphaea colorata]|nr:exonuclease V, chloroplastic isoform X2 [Nymphaea colorata]